MAAPKKQSRSPKQPKPTVDDATAAIDKLIVRGGKGPQAVAARLELRDLAADVVMPRLLHHMTHAHPKVRGAAFEIATGSPAFREHAPLATIVAGADDPDPGVRLSVLLCFNRGHGSKNEAVYAPQRETIRPALEKLRVDADKRVAQQAKVVWTRLGLPADE